MLCVTFSAMFRNVLYYIQQCPMLVLSLALFIAMTISNDVIGSIQSCVTVYNSMVGYSILCHSVQFYGWIFNPVSQCTILWLDIQSCVTVYNSMVGYSILCHSVQFYGWIFNPVSQCTILWLDIQSCVTVYNSMVGYSILCHSVQFYGWIFNPVSQCTILWLDIQLTA